jgi:inhibitor of KinA
MQMVPLGDQAILVYFPVETAALNFTAAVRHTPPGWLIDVVQAYTSVAVFFDLEQTHYAVVADFLPRFLADVERQGTHTESRRHCIPCCYDLGLDWRRIEEHTGLSREHIITLHCETEYIVYAIGFCPGFPYLGYLPSALAGVPRLPTPRVQVEAGSVGLTGRQTGIYTEARPGGWNIIGRSPLQLVDVADGYFPLQTGDRVCFERIDDLAFRRLQGQRLSSRRG